ncbi:hypothetical protein EXU57_22795 [Segetibacter sp. 3557_3]|uniref:hypothetical protein n=1 Tax=Segetibacter sp. 3557_3 TaxID=2547429 RepID=UPI0010590958|nr:hypothetical protein [Segetibacter sp. 3557_3]TDH19732.1 hypothetical protein EXU57_22795 [Segetibacter sp. 3557_3]
MSNPNEQNNQPNPEEGVSEDDPVEAGKKAIEAARATAGSGTTGDKAEEEKADAEKWRNEG